MLRVYNQNIWGNMPKEEAVSNRNQLVRSLIRKYQPDFCTLQECNPSTSIRKYQVPVIAAAERFQVLTEHDALVSSDHCPLVGDFLF